MLWFVSKFGNASTAANYMGVIKWFCRIRNLIPHWGSERLKMLLEGFKKYTMAQMAGELHGELALLNDPGVLSCKTSQGLEDGAVSFDTLGVVVRPGKGPVGDTTTSDG